MHDERVNLPKSVEVLARVQADYMGFIFLCIGATKIPYGLDITGSINARKDRDAVNAAHDAIVKPLREKADSLCLELKGADEYSKEQYRGYTEQIEALKKDRDAWKMEAEDSRAVLRHHVEERNKARADADRLAEALKAKDDLLVCYRTGKRPSEVLFKRLEKAKEALAAHEALKGGL